MHNKDAEEGCISYNRHCSQDIVGISMIGFSTHSAEHVDDESVFHHVFKKSGMAGTNFQNAHILSSM